MNPYESPQPCPTTIVDWNKSNQKFWLGLVILIVGGPGSLLVAWVFAERTCEDDEQPQRLSLPQLTALTVTQCCWLVSIYCVIYYLTGFSLYLYLQQSELQNHGSYNFTR